MGRQITPTVTDEYAKSAYGDLTLIFFFFF